MTRTRILALAFAFVITVLVVDHLRQPPSRSYDFQPTRFTFELPVMFLQCLRYPLQSGEHFENWRLEQPIVLDATINAPLRDVMIRNVYWMAPPFGCQQVMAPEPDGPLCGSDDPNVPYKADKPWQHPGGICDMEIYEREMRK